MLAGRLNLLLHAFARPRPERGQRGEWTNGQVARAAEHLYGRPVFSGETVGQARVGALPRGSASARWATRCASSGSFFTGSRWRATASG
jgi:hypothetical protein